MKQVIFTLLALLYFTSGDAQAACDSGADAANQVTTRFNDGVLFVGNCADDNDVLILTNSIVQYSSCSLLSTVGVVDVLVSLNGETFSTVPLSLRDEGATDTNPVIVTVVGRIYLLPQLYRRIKILQNGATDATAHLFCKK